MGKKVYVKELFSILFWFKSRLHRIKTLKPWEAALTSMKTPVQSEKDIREIHSEVN